MNSYVLLHRIKGPAMLLVFGVTALLDEYGVLSYGQSWPLYLIVLGLLQLAERAALAKLPPPPPGYGYPGNYPGGYAGQYPGAYTGSYTGPYPGPAPSQPPSSGPTTTAIVPSSALDQERR